MYLQRVRKYTLSPFSEKHRYIIEIESTPWNWKQNVLSIKLLLCSTIYKFLQKLHSPTFHSTFSSKTEWVFLADLIVFFKPQDIDSSSQSIIAVVRQKLRIRFKEGSPTLRLVLTFFDVIRQCQFAIKDETELKTSLCTRGVLSAKLAYTYTVLCWHRW